MKIDGIELLEKMKNKEIKEGTRIECSRFVGNNIHIVYEENELKLYDRNGEGKWTGVIRAEDLLNYTFEIIEEDKEIEKLDLNYKDIIYGTNFKEQILSYCDNLQYKINELIKEVNKLKNKLF